MNLHQAIEILDPKTTMVRFMEIVSELGYATQGWNPKIFRDAAETVLPVLKERMGKAEKVSYRDKLKEIVGNDRSVFDANCFGGVRDCPGEYFEDAITLRNCNCCEPDACDKCWNSTYLNEPYIC